MTGTHSFEVVKSTERFAGRVISVVSDEVTMPDGGTAVRDYVRHIGAVGAAAIDEEDRVLLVRQYRHPVRRMLWELPAGLLDVDGESALDTAKRELWEEADLRADTWHVLADLLPTPGSSDEAIRLYLARDVTAVPDGERHTRTGEEHTMTVGWVPIDTAVEWVFSGEIENAACVAGVLAAARARDTGFTNLRPAGAPWPARPGR
ncbi:MAG: 8-oxo-dGDP phosphatase [Cryptosporangiaceae bacterium]|jgi:ADP-ribose pyrophosphatase|nr:8-oxo-dGDP phosphatase [Cryptosporangiaceae bacterium]